MQTDHKHTLYEGVLFIKMYEIGNEIKFLGCVKRVSHEED